MATNRTFQEMLNEYLPNKLLREELIKRDYFLKNVEKDNNWTGGTLVVPFQGSRASTVKFGSLTAEADINQSTYIRGEITNQPEIWGSLVFDERDLMEHNKLSEQNFLKLLPDEIEDFIMFMKRAVSISFTVGDVFATALVDGTAGGVVKVDRIERFELGMPLQLQDDDTASAKYWVKEVNVNDDTVTLSATVTLVSAANVSAYTVAQNAVFRFDGNETAGNRLTNIKSSLLSAANGGASTLYGISKLASPATQAINIDGADITAVNLLDKIFDAQTKVRNKGKGLPDKIVMSYKNLGSALKTIEVAKGAYKQVGDPRAELYGWTEVDVMGVRGKLTLVAIQEMDDDAMYILDMRALKIYSNGFFRKRKDPGDQKEYFTVRATTGFKYICDITFFGDIVLQRPSRCGIIHGISYTI